MAAINGTPFMGSIGEFVADLIASCDVGASSNRPNKTVILGVSGPQGSGKTTWTRSFAQALCKEINPVTKRSYKVVSCSLDDFYLTHEEQQKVIRGNPDNDLIKNRGEPGTHDVKLASDTLSALRQGVVPTKIPFYDKSAFNGQGDRAPESSWTKVDEPLDLVLFEGWCVGFTPINDEQELKSRWAKAVEALKRRQTLFPTDGVKSSLEHQVDPVTVYGQRLPQLGKHPFSTINFINSNLADYAQDIWSQFDGLIYFDADRIEYVYPWRLQQEHDLIAQFGAGMADSSVLQFIDRYMPAYELYSKALAANSIFSEKGRYLRVGVSFQHEFHSLLLF